MWTVTKGQPGTHTFDAGFFDPARDAGFLDGGFAAPTFEAGFDPALEVEGGLLPALEGGFDAGFVAPAFDAGLAYKELI